MITQANGVEIKNLKQFKSEQLFGASITRLLESGQLPSVGFDHVRIPKGSALQPHVHKVAESFIYVLQGTAIVTLDSKNYLVAVGDTIYIPPGTSHGFSTANEDVILLSVQSPPIYPENSAADIKFKKGHNPLLSKT
ncbi:hypothetical protein A6770_39825 [Nostoc minutum NIES-26]|uniref:Cupin type-1 domain-containing protein n=1 Tax=Nostoc minutum NIES-26 TaxID=1844469 RepID=A0A367RQ76_9NOSO|nr:hypothetical protein A6770_39825 [Nostoc minutum NIES-26]